MKRVLIMMVGLALIAGCGRRAPLEPPPGAPPPPVPMGAARPMTPEELLTPPTIARPSRVDELLRRSERRQEDRFDLPPSDVAPGPETQSGRDPANVATGTPQTPPEEDDPGRR